MRLSENQFIMQAYGSNAKWIELEHKHLKGIVFTSNSRRLSRYDEIHLGRFISSGIYAELLKSLHDEIGERLLFHVEYGVLNVCVVMKGATNISILKSYTVGLFYGRTFEDIFNKAKEVIANSLLNEIRTTSQTARRFFELFKKDELNTAEDIESSIDKYREVSGRELQPRESTLIRKYSYCGLEE